MEDDKFKDLLEDEELTALRLAALATKKKNERTVDNSSETAGALPINSIVTASETVSNQIPFLQSDRNAFNNNYAWRKLNQTMRRRGGAFPKNNQRSNLIVISPVVLNEGKDSEEKAPALLLPQHKWSNSGNEDSMSPKTLRKTGPTRFNRHGSDSESSDDSDYEPSDNDSGSNETVLQDEPSEKFSRLSPDSDSVGDDVEKKRRLSFQRLDSDVKSDSFDKTEATSVYNLLKSSSYADNKQDNYATAQSLSDSRHNWSHPVEGEYGSYKQYNSSRAYSTKLLDAPESFSVKQTNLSVTSNGESSVDKSCTVTQSTEKSNTWHHARNRTNDSYPENSRNLVSNDQKSKGYLDNRQSLPESDEMQGVQHSVWQHEEELRASSSFYPRETTYNNPKNYKGSTSKSQLCENDLRLELKKRMQEVKSQSTVNDSSDITQKKYDQRNTSEKNRLRYGYEENKISDTFDKSSFVNKQETSNLHTDKSNDQNSTTLSQRKGSENHENDLLDNFVSAGKRKMQYSERSRYNRSSSLGRSRNDHSPSRDRNRHDRSSSWDRRHDRSLSPNKSKSYREDRAVKSRISVERNFSGDRKTEKFKSNQSRRLSERSSSRDRSKRDHSSSSGSRHSRSLSRERSRRSYYSKRNKRSRSISRNRSRHKRSLSRDRHSHSSSRSGNRYSRSHSHDRSRSQSSTSDRSRSREWSKCSSNQDESRVIQSTSKTMSASQNNLSSSVYSLSHKSKYSASFSQEQSQKESVLDPEQGSKNSQHKKIEYTQNSTQMINEEFEKFTKEQSKSVEESRLQSAEKSEKKGKIKRSPRKFNRRNDAYKNRHSRSRSSSSDSYSSSFSSSSSYDSKPKLRSVPSVIKPVVTKKLDSKSRESPNEIKTSGKSICSAISKSDTYSASKSDNYKKNIDVSDSNKLSTLRCRIDGDLKVSDNNKRVPVHMRLGVFPRKRVIQMPKDVEAAFVNSSSSGDSENVNTKCKRQNFRIVTNVYEVKSGVDSLSIKPLPAEKPAKRSPDMYQDKSKRLKAHR